MSNINHFPEYQYGDGQFIQSYNPFGSKPAFRDYSDLRGSDPEFHEFAVKMEISDFFISGQEKPFGDLFTKITTKLSKEFLFSRNSTKREMPYLLRSRHEILSRFGAFSKRSGRKTA